MWRCLTTTVAFEGPWIWKFLNNNYRILDSTPWIEENSHFKLPISVPPVHGLILSFSFSFGLLCFSRMPPKRAIKETGEILYFGERKHFAQYPVIRNLQPVSMKFRVAILPNLTTFCIVFFFFQDFPLKIQLNSINLPFLLRKA